MTDFYFTGDFLQIFFRRISFTRRFLFFFLSGRFFCTDLFLLSGDDIFSWVFSPGEWFFRRFLFTRKFSFLLFNSRIFFFPGYSLCFSGDFTIHIFSLLQEIFFFPWNFFFCSEYFFQKIGLQEKKNNFLRNKKKEKESPGKKKKRKNNPNPVGKSVSRK